MAGASGLAAVRLWERQRRSGVSGIVWNDRQQYVRTAMRPLEPVPAIRRIDTDRADLCALDVVGRLTSADLENAFGLLEAARLDHPEIDLLARLPGYDGIDWDGVFTPSTLRGKLSALGHVRRCALVGGPAWISTTLGMFGSMASMETRHFEEAEEGSAWDWLGARPVDAA
jgi:hypothetical protein